jgi:sugar phosphate isomerase/epimerase
MALEITENIRHITSRCFINAPFDFLKDNIDSIINLGIQPEIGLENDILYTFSLDEFSEVARKLKAASLSCTLHAPFHELSVGALDPFIREASRNKLRKAFNLIEVFEPRSIVCHLGFEDNKHGYKQEKWFNNSLEGWQELLEIAEVNKTHLMLENTYETSPLQLKEMIEALDSQYARFCLDVGHTLTFAKNRWQDWLPELEPWLGQLHLHDNHGDRDTHLPIGQGLFDFDSFVAYLKVKNLSPIMTLEPHREEDVVESLLAFDKVFTRD